METHVRSHTSNKNVLDSLERSVIEEVFTEDTITVWEA